MVNDLSPRKSACVLAIVVGCFAVLWPNIFYPMLKRSALTPADDMNGCCDVLLDKDVNGVKLISELCNAVLRQTEHQRSTSDISLSILNKNEEIEHCRSVVLDTCGVDIRALLQNKIQLNPSYKHVLEELRTFNKSLCLKYHFDITLDLLGAPHRVKKFNASSSKYPRPERLSHVRQRELHPAFHGSREGPLPEKQTKKKKKAKNASPDFSPQRLHQTLPIAAKKPPVPGLRPPIGAGGHVQSQKIDTTMSILMPMYTVGIVIFFGYTILKLMCKKRYSPTTYERDPEFRKMVFHNNSQGKKLQGNEKTNGIPVTEPCPKLVVTAISSLLQEVNRDILEREANNLKNETFVVQSNDKNSITDDIEQQTSSNENKETEKEPENNRDVEGTEKTSTDAKVNGTIEVVGMEINESCENGQRWTGPSQLPKVTPPPPSEVVQEIILSGNVPTNSQIFVSDAHTENVPTDDNSSNVIIESKVILNVISSDDYDDGNSKNTTNDINNVEYENGYSQEFVINDSNCLKDSKECTVDDVGMKYCDCNVSERRNSKNVLQGKDENTEL